MSFQTYINFFLLQNTKTDILKNVGNQPVLLPFDFHCFFVHITEVNGNKISSKYLHTGLERHEGE